MSPSQEFTTATAWLRKQTRQITEQETLPVDEQTGSAVPVEAWLQRCGVAYAPPTGIPLTMIDEKRSRANQARKDPLVSESVERFAAAFRQGRPFPPIVVYPMGSKVVIIDGNNRHEAAKRARCEYIRGIIISPDTSSEMIQLLTVEANATHGVTPPLEWRVRQAFHLVSLGHGDERSAEAAGITISQLRNARAASEAEQRAKILRIAGFTELPAVHKQKLNALKNEPVFFAAAVMVIKHQLISDQVGDLVRKIKSGRSESEQLSILAEAEELLAVESAAMRAMDKRRVSSPKTSLVTGIGLLRKIDPVALVNQIRTVQDRDLVAQRLKDLEQTVLNLQVAMEDLKDMEE